ncbi:hypothetical protein ACI65C_012400 [Semiaphis heraclei]
MDSSNEDIDQKVLREAGEQTISAEWSATVSALNSSDATSSNSFINIETLKECCANLSDTLKDKEDFMVFESSSTVVNISKCNANDTKYYSERKTTAFQKKHKPFSQNVSCYFENVLDDDSQMEITQNSICLNRFQKRKRLIPPNDEDFIEINNSNFSGSNSVDVSIMKSPKFCFSKKKKNQFEIPDYNLSATDSDSIANDTNTSKRRNTSNCSLVVNESSDNMKNVSNTEAFTHKFNLKTIDVADSVFENIINNSSIISDITLNNKKTSLNETAISNNTSVLSKKDLSNLNHTYDIIPNNTNFTLVKASIVDNADTPKVKQNTVFKKPSNLSVLVNDSSNNIMDVSKTEVYTQKFSRKSIGIPDSVFDNIINDSSMNSDVALNNKKSFLNETSVSNINNSKMDISNLNYTYDIPTHINTSKNDVSIADDANMPNLKQLNPSIIVNDSSNNITDVSKTEVLTQKFSRKAIDVADSAFDNIINNSSIISNITLNNKNASSTKILVSNVDNPVLNKMDMSSLNHTYGIPTNIDISIASDANIPKVKQSTDLEKPANSSLVIKNSSNNIKDVTKTEILTHKFSRKTIDVTHSVFDNIIDDSSMTSEIALNNKKVALIETSVSNTNNTPVFSTMDVSNLNHTYDIPQNNSTTLLDAIVEHDKSISETPVLIQNNRSKSFNLLPLKFNFSNKFGRHSLSLQENCPSIGLVQKHNISLNTDFIKNTGEESTSFHKSANNSNLNLKLHPHITVTQENNSSPEIQPLDDSLPTNRLNQEQLQPNHSISSTSTNEGLTLLNSTSGLLGSCSSSRTQSRLLTSKESSTSNNDTLNLTMESLDSNESKNDRSKHSISSTSSNEGLTLINSTTGFSRSCSSSRSRSTSKLSNNDSLTLLNTTTESLKSNKSQITQSNHSKSSTSFNESLKSTNSTTEFSRRRSSSKNKSTSSKHSTSIISNNESLTSLNDSTEISVDSSSSRNKSLSTSSKHSTSTISNSDNLLPLDTSVGSLKNDESQKTQSKRSISPTSYTESLKLTNSIKEYSEKRSSSRNKSTSSKHSTSTISNSDNLLLLDTSVGSLKHNESQKTQSKRSISPPSYNESLKSTNSIKEYSEKRSSSRIKSTSSKHSTSTISNSDNLLLLDTSVGSLKNNESQKMQSKHSISPPSYNESLKSTNSIKEYSEKRSSSRIKSTSSKHSTSVISNNESLTLLKKRTEISVGSSSSRNKSLSTSSKHSTSKMQSKCLKSPTSYNESLKLTNSTAALSERRRSSRNKSISSKHSTSVISNSENLPLLNVIAVGSLKNNESQKMYSKRSISLNSSKESIKSTNSTTGISGKRSSSRNKSSLLTSKHSTSVVSNNDSLTSLNAITEISVGSSLSRNQTQHSISVISNNDTLSLSNASSMESLKSNKSLKTQSTSPTLNIENLTIFNTTTESLKQNALSINRSTSKHSSSVISKKASINALMLDDVINNVSRMSTRSSKQKNNFSGNVEPVTYDDIEQIKPNTNDGPLIETRVLRSSLRINKKKSSLTKLLATERNVNNLSIGSTRTSKDKVNFDNDSDDSLLWTTLPDDSTNISSTQNINMDTFQTPKRNKLTIAENIVNTIKIMSTNNKKCTHPGAFELDDHNDRPTRSFVTRSYNHSPSILTLVFGGQKTSESTLSLTQSPSEIIFDQSQVEENVKQKFKSLYKKEPWITKRLYKFLIIKLQPNYNIYSVKYAEKFVKYLAQLFKQIYNDQVNLQLCTDMLRYHMARYNIIKDTFDYLGFLTDYIPMEYYKKLVPGWNLETSAIKFDPQKYYIPLMDDEEFLNYIMEHLNKA